ncbi:MAG TPA: hypothetical protein VK961_07605 [Chthoniobacter sp.]|nr:hypothetical protein [Chthoniobacter sp.]
MTALSLVRWSDADQRAIRAQLVRITQSGPFLQSRRRQRFLNYIVNEVLAGRGERIKGYSVALEVFDRPESFDPVVDPIVRIEAVRLREKLREYYEAVGRSDPVVIELPKGTYSPHIRFRRNGTGDYRGSGGRWQSRIASYSPRRSRAQRGGLRWRCFPS